MVDVCQACVPILVATGSIIAGCPAHVFVGMSLCRPRRLTSHGLLRQRRPRARLVPTVELRGRSDERRSCAGWLVIRVVLVDGRPAVGLFCTAPRRASLASWGWWPIASAWRSPSATAAGRRGGSQQVRFIWTNIGAFHVCLWTFAMTEAWAWGRRGGFGGPRGLAVGGIRRPARGAPPRPALQTPAVVNGLRLDVEATRCWATGPRSSDWPGGRGRAALGGRRGVALGPGYLRFPIGEYRWRSASPTTAPGCPWSPTTSSTTTGARTSAASPADCRWSP